MVYVIMLASVVFFLLSLQGLKISRPRKDVADYFYFPRTRLHSSFTLSIELVQVVSGTFLVISVLSFIFAGAVAINTAF